jgi:alkylhydroperoxidase family enzyme
MPRIEPVPWDDLSEEARARIEAGMASGMYSTPLPLQIMAHSPNALQGMDDSYKAVFGRSAVGGRLQELVRLRSAQLGSCEPCSASRKDDSLSESDVACLGNTSTGAYSDRERLAIELVDLLATDPAGLDADFYSRLGTHFSVEEIVELGWYAGQAIGTHRFMHSLDILGDSPPVLGRTPVAPSP